MDIDVDLLIRISLGVDHLSIIQSTFFFLLCLTTSFSGILRPLIVVL